MDQHELKYTLALPKGVRSNLHKPVYRPQLPRVTQLMALAIRFEDLLAQHPELSYSDLARLSGVCRARITEILNLLCLAPDLQERLLFLKPNSRGRDRIHEPALRKIIQIEDWSEQRRQFEAKFGSAKLDEGDQG
jgi:hypothetical protein